MNYKERFIAEYQELTAKFEKLEQALNADESDINLASLDLLTAQYCIMGAYLSILRERATVENIELEAGE